MGKLEYKSLRCEEVCQAISASVDGDDRSALAGHLASCPRCASWAERNAALNVLWDASRPVGPSDLVWDSTWAKIGAVLDREAEPALVSISTASRWWMQSSTVRILTQAAALFLAVSLLWVRPWQTRVDVENSGLIAQAAPSEVEIPEGQIALIRHDRGKTTLHTIEIAQVDGVNSLDRSYAFLWELESRAE